MKKRTIIYSVLLTIWSALLAFYLFFKEAHWRNFWITTCLFWIFINIKDLKKSLSH